MKFRTLTFTGVLIASFLLVGVTASEYDPWLDVNDDGEIDIFDVVKVAGAYGTTGISINKTELLLELLLKVDILNSTVEELRSQIAEMNTTIGDLQTSLTILNATKLGVPDYDSGWVIIGQNEEVILTHSLGTTEVLVYTIGKGPAGNTQMYYGWEHVGANTYGLHWRSLTASTIKVWRAINDTVWTQVRVLIWKTPL